MPRYEYKLVPAPEKASKIRGLKGPARFAATLEALMNSHGAEGWRYLRADTLPQEERSGLTGRQTTFRNILVFVREIPEIVEEITLLPTPEPVVAPPPPPIEIPMEEPALANLFDTPVEPAEEPEDPPYRSEP